MVWTQQSRWIMWGGCVMPEKLQASEATPQGDPWGPLARQLWMAAGNSFVRENLARICAMARPNFLWMTGLLVPKLRKVSWKDESCRVIGVTGLVFWSTLIRLNLLIPLSVISRTFMTVWRMHWLLINGKFLG